MNSLEDHNVIVCDNGTGFVKCGYAGSEIPAFTIPNLVGRPQLRLNPAFEDDVHVKDVAVGDEASRCRAILNVSYPLEKGLVRNWDDMVKVWDYAFGPQKMDIDTKACKILLTETPMDLPRNREKIIETMFEHFGFEGAYIAPQCVLTMFAQGLHTGVVVDCGDGTTYICPVFGGCELSHASYRLDVAGRDITRYLIKLLQRKGYIFNQSADFETVRLIKEKLCYVANDLNLEQQLALETTALTKSYTLPDGRQVKLNAECYQAPEALFRPDLIGIESAGIAEMVVNSIQATDLTMRPALYEHIVLSGGTSMFPGLHSRLSDEIKRLHVEKVLGCKTGSTLPKVNIRVKTLTDRMNAVFIGGSMLGWHAKHCTKFWLSRQDYQEEGVRILDRLRKTSLSLSSALLRRFHHDTPRPTG